MEVLGGVDGQSKQNLHHSINFLIYQPLTRHLRKIDGLNVQLSDNKTSQGSALLFGVGTPLANSLLDAISPWVLASLLFLGSGVGLAIYRMLIGAWDVGEAVPHLSTWRSFVQFDIKPAGWHPLSGCVFSIRVNVPGLPVKVWVD